MNSEEPNSNPRENLAEKWASYLSVAAEVADGPSRSRYGFGALRKHEGVFRNTIEMVAESNVFNASPFNGGFPFGMFDHPFFDPPFFLRRLYRHGMPMPHDFFGKMLAVPCSFTPTPLWAMFWALAKAEHQFLCEFVPYWSNEERLTGHLVALVYERLREFAGHWATLCGTDADADGSCCRLYYADTATARQERFTGADLGLVIHARFPRQEEFFKVVLFQAKKAESQGQARIDLDQAETLMTETSLGYYLFYHAWAAKDWSLAPTVVRASRFESEIKKRREDKPRPKLGEISWDANESGWDFASFLTFAAFDQASDYGVLADSPRSAARIVFGPGSPGGGPSRVMVITLGNPATSVVWNDVFSEHVRRGRTEG